MTRPCVLQFNQAGAWKGALNFDAGDAPPEFLEHMDQALRMIATEATRARIVMARPGAGGGMVASHEVLKYWSRKEGWVS